MIKILAVIIALSSPALAIECRTETDAIGAGLSVT